MCFVSQFSSLVNDYSLLTLFCSLKILTRKEKSPNKGEERRGEYNHPKSQFQNPHFSQHFYCKQSQFLSLQWRHQNSPATAAAYQSR